MRVMSIHGMSTHAMPTQTDGSRQAMQRFNLRQEVDAWRVIPRLMLLLYAYQLYRVTEWFMGLDTPTNAHGLLISTVYGAAAAFFGLYCNSGAKP